jgi:hypothetical protein
MIAPDVFRLNAYRVLRALGSATASDINKAADTMRRGVALGHARTSEIDIPGLGTVPRGDADIRAALRRLADPAQRLADKLFWFCELPTPPGAQRFSSPMDPTGHDAALRALFDAIQGGLDECGLRAWVNALRDWHAVIRDEDYWFLALIHEDDGGFERRATSVEVEALRADAVRIAAEPLIFAARAALVADDRETVRRILTALSELTDTGSWASAAIDDIALGKTRPHGFTGGALPRGRATARPSTP